MPIKALKPGGVWFMSFKKGKGEAVRNGQFSNVTDFGKLIPGERLQAGRSEPVLAYADGVRALFARAASKDRGTGQPAPVETVVPQGEQLASLSESLNVELASNLEAADPEDRITAATRLLAKSLTDLEVSAYLGRAAEQEGAGPATDRAVPATPNVAGYLALLTEESGPGERPGRARGTTAGDLITMVGDDLSIISSRAAAVAKTAFQKLLRSASVRWSRPRDRSA